MSPETSDQKEQAKRVQTELVAGTEQQDSSLDELALPPHGSERLARGLASVDDAMCAEVDAEVERLLATGERPDQSRFRDDGPDPLGTGFAWAGANRKG
jgi:hypothetical protein